MALGESHNEYVFNAIERLVQAGEQVGFSGQGRHEPQSLLDVMEFVQDEQRTLLTSRRVAAGYSLD